MLNSASALDPGRRLPGCKSKTLDAREAADALSDEFSDLLDFGDSTIEQANKDDGATHYIRITPLQADYSVDQITLHVTANAIARPMGGNAFHVLLAFVLADGQVGPYRDWNLVTYPLQGEVAKIVMCQCEQVTEMDPDSGYNVLVSTNLTLATTCQDDSELGYFYGDPLQSYDAKPCNQFQVMYGANGPIEDFVFPSGTRLRPWWFDLGVDPDSCYIQIDCP